MREVKLKPLLDVLGNPIDLTAPHIARLMEIRRKVSAREAVCRAVKSGKLTRPAQCPKCSRSDVRIEAHHEDYDKPLVVEWMCRVCHWSLHHAAKSS